MKLMVCKMCKGRGWIFIRRPIMSRSIITNMEVPTQHGDNIRGVCRNCFGSGKVCLTKDK